MYTVHYLCPFFFIKYFSFLWLFSHTNARNLIFINTNSQTLIRILFNKRYDKNVILEYSIIVAFGNIFLTRHTTISRVRKNNSVWHFSGLNVLLMIADRKFANSNKRTLQLKRILRRPKLQHYWEDWKEGNSTNNDHRRTAKNKKKKRKYVAVSWPFPKVKFVRKCHGCTLHTLCEEMSGANLIGHHNSAPKHPSDYSFNWASVYICITLPAAADHKHTMHNQLLNHKS